MAKIVYRQMPAPWELVLAPRAKARVQKPHGGANFWYKSPGVRGMAMDKIDACITIAKLWAWVKATFHLTISMRGQRATGKISQELRAFFNG